MLDIKTSKDISNSLKDAILKEFKEVVGEFRVESFFSDISDGKLVMAFYTPVKNDLNLELHFYKNDNIETYKLVQIGDKGKENLIVECKFDVGVTSKIIK